MDKKVELRERFGYSRRGNIQEIYDYYNLLEEEVLKLESQLHLLAEMEKITTGDLLGYALRAGIDRDDLLLTVIKAYLESINLESKK